jgi:hypothetical protein
MYLFLVFILLFVVGLVALGVTREVTRHLPLRHGRVQAILDVASGAALMLAIVAGAFHWSKWLPASAIALSVLSASAGYIVRRANR